MKIVEPIIYDDYNGRVRADQQCIGTLTTNCEQEAKGNGVKIIEQIAYDEQNGYLQQDGCVGTLTTDGSTPKHNNRVVEQSYRFYKQAFETLRENNCEVGDTIDAYNKRVNKDGISPTITTRPEGFKTAILPVVKNCRIRKLTPRETYRLMGFDNTDFDNTAYGGVSTTNYRRRLNARTMTKVEWKAFYRLTRTQKMSNSQLYKQAGNSIVVSVLMAIFGKMLNIDYETKIAELVERLKDDSE